MNSSSSPTVPDGRSESANTASLSFDDIYRQQADRVLNLLYRFTNNEASAQDLLQDVFIKVYENLGTFGNRSDVGTWIHRIAVNHALNFLKREQRTMWFDILDETVGALLQKEKIDIPGWDSGPVPTPHNLLETQEREQIVENAVHALPLKYRLPYLLYRDGELSNGEIASSLKLSISAVDTRIHRAKKLLVHRLKPLFLDSG